MLSVTIKELEALRKYKPLNIYINTEWPRADQMELRVLAWLAVYDLAEGRKIGWVGDEYQAVFLEHIKEYRKVSS